MRVWRCVQIMIVAVGVGGVVCGGGLRACAVGIRACY